MKNWPFYSIFGKWICSTVVISSYSFCPLKELIQFLQDFEVEFQVWIYIGSTMLVLLPDGKYLRDFAGMLRKDDKCYTFNVENTSMLCPGWYILGNHVLLLLGHPLWDPKYPGKNIEGIKWDKLRFLWKLSILIKVHCYETKWLVSWWRGAEEEATTGWSLEWGRYPKGPSKWTVKIKSSVNWVLV